MSIIHDALKKVQQGQTPNAGTPADKLSPSDIFSSSAKPTEPDDQSPVEYLPSSPKKARSVLAFLCAIAITVGAFMFLYKQVCSSFPNFKNWAEVSLNKIIHKKIIPPPENLKTLASITVTPSQPVNPAVAVKPAMATATAAPASAPVPVNTPPPVVNTPDVSETPGPVTPDTLNVHGVMSNGKSNVVLINDQVYQEGDDVDGIRIVKISLDSIIVDNNGKEETIPVKN